MMARAGINASGKNQLSFPVYTTNRAKLPQETLGCPKAPHSPNRSATAERKERPRASRKKAELKCMIRPIVADIRGAVPENLPTGVRELEGQVTQSWVVFGTAPEQPVIFAI